MFNLHQRLKLISFIYQNTGVEHKMSFETMSSLWKSFIVEALVKEEKDLFFIWMTETSSSSTFNINIEDLVKFYMDNISFLNNEDISVDGYICF